MASSAQDQWAQWLLQHRHGGSAERLTAFLRHLAPIRDKVLQNTGLTSGKILLDVGCGDGLIAFGALPIVGEQGRVIFSDISQDLLDHSHALAHKMNVIERCEFVRAPAENLDVIADSSVDAVTTRSVLIYVQEKQQAFNEFYRVLKPDGRLSIFEPINNYTYPEPPHTFFGYDVSPVMPLIHKLLAAYACFQPVASTAMMSFTERDLVIFAEQAGFSEVHLELSITIRPERFDPDAGYQKQTWETFLKSSPNPLVPTFEEVMKQALKADEIERLSMYMRPLVENRQRTERIAVAYLWAVKHPLADA